MSTDTKFLVSDIRVVERDSKKRPTVYTAVVTQAHQNRLVSWHLRAESYESDNEPPRGRACTAWAVAGSTRTQEHAAQIIEECDDSNQAYSAPCWAGNELGQYERVAWLAEQLLDTGFKP